MTNTDSLLGSTDYDFENCRTRRDPMGPYHKEDVIEALLFTGGNYAAMSKLLGRRRTSVRDYVLRHRDLVALLSECRETLLDGVEDCVFRSALNGDTANQRFILSTIGKHRGYTTRSEHTGGDGAPMAHEVAIKFIKPSAS